MDEQHNSDDNDNDNDNRKKMKHDDDSNDNDNDDNDDIKNNTDDGRTTIESVDITVAPISSSISPPSPPSPSSSSSSSVLVQDNDSNNNVVDNTSDIDKSNPIVPSTTSLELQPSSSSEPQPSSSSEPQPSSSSIPQASRSIQRAPFIPFDSTIPPSDPRYLTLKNLDTGEEFVIGIVITLYSSQYHH